jgi:hypothetical protein
MLQQFRKLPSESETIDRVQDTLIAVLSPITRDRILNRLEYTAVINTTNTIITHTLGYQPIGWLVIDNNAFANIKRVAWDAQSLTLVASAQCTVKIIIF